MIGTTSTWRLVNRMAFSALCAALAMSTPAASGAGSEAASGYESQRVEGMVAERLKALGSPGGAVAVVYKGRTELVKSYGLANVEFGVAADQDTLFPLASASKLFTAIAIARLIKEGKFSPEDPIGKYLHELPADWARTPIKNLLNHTSGLPDFFSTPEHPAAPEYLAASLEGQLTSFDAALALASKKSREFPLGDHWQYNQTGYALVGKLIEVTTGSSFQNYVRDSVLRPAGMRAATYGGVIGPVIPGFNPTIYRRNADGSYVRDIRGVLIYPPAVYPAGGLSASITDIASFLRYMDQELSAKDSALSIACAKRYQATVRLGGVEPGWQYGLGCIVLNQDGHLAVGHGGGQGFVWILLYPDDRLGVAVVTNLTGDHALRLSQEIAEVYLQPKRR